MMTGNQDKEGKHPFPNNWEKHLVVYQEKVKLVEGNLVPLPNQSGLQTYNRSVFDAMTKNKFFSESDLRVTIVHDPALLEEPLKQVRASKKKEDEIPE